MSSAEFKNTGLSHRDHEVRNKKNAWDQGARIQGHFQSTSSSKYLKGKDQGVSTVPKVNQCRVCGKRHTGIQNCKYKNYHCNLCSSIGHLAVMCNKSKSTNFLNIEKVEENTFESLILNIETNDSKPIMLDVKINDIKLKAQLDSGSGLTIISEKTFYELFDKNTILNKVFKNVNGYTGEKINILGFFFCKH
jgi:hypothetical protein